MRREQATIVISVTISQTACPATPYGRKAGAKGWRADLTGVELSGVDLGAADLGAAVLHRAAPRRINLAGALLAMADLSIGRWWMRERRPSPMPTCVALHCAART